MPAAVAALERMHELDASEPTGWIRASDGRRRPNGDEAKEYVQQ